MKTSDAFPSQWLAAADVDPAVVVTVSGLTQEEVGQKKELKPVLWFQEQSKGLIINKTNWQATVKICGSDDSDDWVGKAVELYSTLVQFAGEEVHAIRVRAPKTAKLPDNVLSIRGNAIKQQDAGGRIGVQVQDVEGGPPFWAAVNETIMLSRLKTVGGELADWKIRKNANGKFSLIDVSAVAAEPPAELAEAGRGDDIPF